MLAITDIVRPLPDSTLSEDGTKVLVDDRLMTSLASSVASMTKAEKPNETELSVPAVYVSHSQVENATIVQHPEGKITVTFKEPPFTKAQAKLRAVSEQLEAYAMAVMARKSACQTYERFLAGTQYIMACPRCDWVGAPLVTNSCPSCRQSVSLKTR